MWERLKLAINQPVFSGEGATAGDGAKKKASKAR
jgi:6-phosphofructokinase 1